jgi:hypothetical protein
MGGRLTFERIDTVFENVYNFLRLCHLLLQSSFSPPRRIGSETSKKVYWVRNVREDYGLRLETDFFGTFLAWVDSIPYYDYGGLKVFKKTLKLCENFTKMHENRKNRNLLRFLSKYYGIFMTINPLYYGHIFCISTVLPRNQLS